MRRWLTFLLSPPRFGDDDEKNRVASLLNTILLVLTAVFIANTLIAIFFNPVPIAILLNAATCVIGLGLIFLLRWRQVTLAAWATVLIFWTMVTVIAYLLSGMTNTIITSFMVLIVLAGVLAGNRALILITLLSLVFGGFLFYLEETGRFVAQTPDNALANITSSGGNLVVIAVLLGLTLRDLNRTLTTARRVNRALQEVQANLELRVIERTRDLALAAEVGRSISQVRDPDLLLNEACELIRQSFNLYHVQIYLSDNAGQNLLLRAATGEAGQILLRRRQTLAIAPNSINGAAALQKTSIVVSDTSSSPLFRPNPLLPETRAEMAVPLLLGGNILGVLDLQSNLRGSLTPEIVPAFEIVASQLAVALDNARLLALANRAQSEMESYLQKLTREGWANYLDAIKREEKVAYVYDAQQKSLQPAGEISPISPTLNVLQVPIQLANEPIGMLQVEAGDERHWTEEAMTLATTVAQQVAQQLESLRLLEEAERYRIEAETAVRRLTRESWQLYQEQAPVSGFVYRKNRIQPLLEEDETGPLPNLVQPLQVRGETIGKLSLQVEVTPEVTAMVQAVSNRLSEHLENLRLSRQTELALAESQRRSAELGVINQVATSAAAQLEATSLLETVFRQMGQVLPIDAFQVMQYDQGHDQVSLLYGVNPQEEARHNLPPAHLQPDHPAYQVIRSRQPILILRTEGPGQTTWQQQGANPPDDLYLRMPSQIYVPLLRGKEVTGVLGLQCQRLNAYRESDLNLVSGIASYLSTALQNAALFAAVQRQGEKERIINTVSQRIQSTLSVEEALQTAVTELGKALQAHSAQVELLTFASAQARNGRSQPVPALASE